MPDCHDNVPFFRQAGYHLWFLWGSQSPHFQIDLVDPEAAVDFRYSSISIQGLLPTPPTFNNMLTCIVHLGY